VVAKATRDALMEVEAEHFPAYGFESNRGYPAPVHKCALSAFGPTTIHRRSWVFMDGLPWADDPIWAGGDLDPQPTLFDDLDLPDDLYLPDDGAPVDALDLTGVAPVLLDVLDEEPEPLVAAARVPSRRRRSG
jgi:hypothetical protein